MEDMVFDSSLLALAALVTCLVCIWLVFSFGRRLQTSAYLRDSLVEGIKQRELQHLSRDLYDQACSGPLDLNNPPPDGFGPTYQLWDGTRPFYEDYSREPYEEDESDEQKNARICKFKACKEWANQERIRYKELQKKNEEIAFTRAEKKVPQSIDISLLGGGWAFLLEFSTVIVIIFTLLIFGILGVLEGKDISTILAAIAGYVLGKASMGAKQGEKESKIT